MRLTFAGPIILAAMLAAAPGARAQESPAPPPAAVLTIEPDRLFADTMYGRAVLARLEEQAEVLQAENRRIEAELETEEKNLTERRDVLPAAEFRILAEAFDAKVEAIRTAQDAKVRRLAQEREAERKKVLEAAVPILVDLMAERGASAILDKSAVLVAFDRNNITAEAISRVDAVLGAGPATPTEDPAAPGTPPAPGTPAPGTPAPNLPAPAPDAVDP
jgi:Skp family chaperone for outer membrane proteins